MLNTVDHHPRNPYPSQKGKYMIIDAKVSKILELYTIRRF
jgi:hypothetical protein